MKFLKNLLCKGVEMNFSDLMSLNELVKLIQDSIQEGQLTGEEKMCIMSGDHILPLFKNHFQLYKDSVDVETGKTYDLIGIDYDQSYVDGTRLVDSDGNPID